MSGQYFWLAQDSHGAITIYYLKSSYCVLSPFDFLGSRYSCQHDMSIWIWNCSCWELMSQITSCQPPKALPFFMTPLTKYLQTSLQNKGIFNLSSPAPEYLISHKTLLTLIIRSQICFLLLGPMTTSLYGGPYTKVKTDLKEFLPSSPLSRKKERKKMLTPVTLQPLRTKPAP